MVRLNFVSAVVALVIIPGIVFAQLQNSEKASSTPTKHKAKSTIIVRPGPPVKPTQAAKPNGPQKSDWGNSASPKR